MSEEITRREVLTGVAGVAGGYLVAQRVQDGNAGITGGPLGDDENEVTIMPGEISEQYYYPTIAEFENEVGTPDTFPALVLTDEGGFVYDG